MRSPFRFKNTPGGIKGGWLTVGMAEGERRIVVLLSPGSPVASGRGQTLSRYLPVALHSATHPISEHTKFEVFEVVAGPITKKRRRQRMPITPRFNV